MRGVARFVALALMVAFVAGMFGCAGANSQGSKQSEILKRMQTSHRNH